MYIKEMEKPTKVKKDKVKPNHYKGKDGLEVIDVLKNFLTPEQFKGFLLGNVIKYSLRFQHKNGFEDLEKSSVYLSWLKEHYYD